MRLAGIQATIFLFSLTVTLSAQKRVKQTIVLGNGTSLEGIVVADSSDYLKLRLTTPRVLTIRKSDILQVAPEYPVEKPFTGRQGYAIRLSVSTLVGRDSEGNNGNLSIHLSNSYQFGNGISVGFGTGLEELNVPVMPFYADLRYYPMHSRLSPFIWMKSGWSLAFGHLENGQYYYYGLPKSRGGNMFNAGTGIELASWRRNAVIIGVGYRYQKISFSYDNSRFTEPVSEIITRFNRVEVQFGLVFR